SKFRLNFALIFSIIFIAALAAKRILKIYADKVTAYSDPLCNGHLNMDRDPEYILVINGTELSSIRFTQRDAVYTKRQLLRESGHARSDIEIRRCNDVGTVSGTKES